MLGGRTVEQGELRTGRPSHHVWQFGVDSASVLQPPSLGQGHNSSDLLRLQPSWGVPLFAAHVEPFQLCQQK